MNYILKFKRRFGKIQQGINASINYEYGKIYIRFA